MKLIDFSPEEELNVVLAHVAKNGGAEEIVTGLASASRLALAPVLAAITDVSLNVIDKISFIHPYSFTIPIYF